MSYILDALRKAERERHLGQAPNLTAAPLLDESRPWRVGPWLGAGLGLGLGLSGALLAVWLNRPAPPVAALPAAPVTPPPSVIAAVPPAPVPPPVAAPEAPRAAAPPVVKPPAPAAPPVVKPPAPAAPPVVKPTAPASPPPRREPSAKVVAPEPPRSTPTPARPERREPPTRQPVTPGVVTIAPASEPIPPLDTLPASARRGLPTLNLDIHIYSPDPQQRFVVINGRRYREGERLGEGLVLETVTGDGAILRQGNQRFRLSVRR